MKHKFLLGLFGLSLVLLPGCDKPKTDGNVSPSEIPNESITPNAATPMPDPSTPSPASTADYADIYIPKVTENTDSYTVFSLIFLDNDDIPELFAYDRGNSISSIYTVKDGSIHCLVDSMSAAEMTYFEHSGIIASFASWNGGGDEGGYGTYYYQVSNDITLTDDSSPILNNAYNATYDGEGAYTGTGVTSYYYMGQETDKESYLQQLDSLGILENNEKLCQENALGREEMLLLLNQ